MRNEWLKIILHLTNRIYTRKQAIIGQSGLAAASTILQLVFAEIALGIISLPLYLTTRSRTVVAFFEEKGAYSKVASDYSIRRVLTLTGVGIAALIWAFKLSFYALVPSFYGPLHLYSVSPLRPVDLATKDFIASEIGIQTARVVETFPAPSLTDVRKGKSGTYVFSGKGKPNTSVVLFVSDQQTVIYTGDVNKDGTWSISHSQQTFHLGEGNHSALVFGYDHAAGTRSRSTSEQYFKVTTTWWDAVIKNIDTIANWSVVILVLVGLFLTFLTL